jgi:hypothetical protein
MSLAPVGKRQVNAVLELVQVAVILVYKSLVDEYNIIYLVHGHRFKTTAIPFLLKK